MEEETITEKTPTPKPTEEPQKSSYSGEMVEVKAGSKKLKVHASFKKVMDEYEAFFDEYVKLAKNPSSLGYITALAKYASTMSALEEIEDQDLTDDETAYYIYVMNRITKKLAEVE